MYIIYYEGINEIIVVVVVQAVILCRRDVARCGGDNVDSAHIGTLTRIPQIVQLLRVSQTLIANIYVMYLHWLSADDTMRVFVRSPNFFKQQQQPQIDSLYIYRYFVMSSATVAGEKNERVSKSILRCLDEKYNLVEIRYYTAFIIRYMA